jgi:hypothetical protein
MAFYPSIPAPDDKFNTKNLIGQHNFKVDELMECCNREIPMDDLKFKFDFYADVTSKNLN